MERSPEDQNSASADHLVGRLLDERYRLESRIGRGGMGSVYRALDVRLDRPVAVKVLSDPDGGDDKRFAAEVRTLARFAHPNLVRLFDAGELDGRPYLVMELIEGETLAQRLARGALSDYESARIGAGVASALAYVHEQGIVHRDVKPANVLLDAKGDAHLADFGIARLVDSTGMTAVGFTLGTPAYLAPEQVQGTTVGPSADVYALGLVLLECLSGRRAFEGTASEITAARLHRDPEIPGGIDASWREVLSSMTRRQAADRLPAAQVAPKLSARALHDGVVSPVVDEKLATAGTTMRLSGSQSGDTGSWDTVRLDPTMTDVVATDVLPKITSTASPRRFDVVRSPRGRVTAVAFGIVIVMLFVGLVLGGVFSNKPRQSGAASSTSSTTTSSTTTSSTTTTTVPISIASAAGSVLSVLNAGVTNGTVAPPAGQQLDNQLQPFLFSAHPELPTQQVQQFDQLVMSFDQDVANGQITGNSTTLLSRAINRLAVALGTTVPTATTTPAPPGPKGHGNGHGKSPGKDH